MRDTFIYLTVIELAPQCKSFYKVLDNCDGRLRVVEILGPRTYAALRTLSSKNFECYEL
jgi:hypothetical protein